MTLSECGLTDEMFTHIDNDEARTQTTYNVTQLLRHTTGIAPVRIPVEEHHTAFLIENRGVERERMKALVEHPQWLARPIVFIKRAEDDHLLVDGTHRYCTFFMIGMDEIPARIIPADVAAPFIITDVPQTDEEMLRADRSIQVARALGLVGGPEPEDQ